MFCRKLSKRDCVVLCFKNGEKANLRSVMADIELEDKDIASLRFYRLLQLVLILNARMTILVGRNA